MVIYNGKIEIQSYFSDDLQHRYYLKRKYHSDKYSYLIQRKLCYILINPSYADELLFDKTNMLASNIGVRENFNEVVILNMYSLITKDKKFLMKKLGIAYDSINDATILNECLEAEQIILSWGIDEEFQERQNELLNLLKSNGLLEKSLRIVFEDRNGKIYDPAHLSMYLSDNPYNFKIKKFNEL